MPNIQQSGSNILGSMWQGKTSPNITANQTKKKQLTLTSHSVVNKWLKVDCTLWECKDLSHTENTNRN